MLHECRNNNRNKLILAGDHASNVPKAMQKHSTGNNNDNCQCHYIKPAFSI